MMVGIALGLILAVVALVIAAGWCGKLALWDMRLGGQFYLPPHHDSVHRRMVGALALFSLAFAVVDVACLLGPVRPALWITLLCTSAVMVIWAFVAMIMARSAALRALRA